MKITLLLVLVSLTIPIAAAAQSGSAYVPHEKVNAALARGGQLIADSKIRVAGGHHAKAGALPTETGTTIFYVTDGAGQLTAAGKTQVLSKGDVFVVPAGTPRSFTSVSPSISYYEVVVPVHDTAAKAEVTYVAHDKVAATLKKAGPLADVPNARVSGGYRTGPYAPEDYRPDVEVHVKEADLFYVIDGTATQVLGGTVVGGKDTGPGQIRGSKIDGGQTYHLAKGDVMWVPAGVPHWFPEIPQPLSYFLVKVFY